MKYIFAVLIAIPVLAFVRACVWSSKKTLIMDKIIKSMNRPVDILSFMSTHSTSDLFSTLEQENDNLDLLFEALFVHLKKASACANIINIYDTSGKEFHKIASRISLAGYGFQGRDFLPVALLAFPAPMQYLLEHKDELLNHSNKEIQEVVEVARRML